jgi:sulfonate transport system permease protein
VEQRIVSAVLGRPSVDRRALALPAVLIAAWAGVSAFGGVNPHLLVPPKVLGIAIAQSLAGPDYWVSVGSSLARLCVGFSVGAFVGIVVGLALGTSRIADRLGAPSLNGVRQIALFAWIPLLTAWFGDGEAAKVILIALAAFFPIALNTEIGRRQVARALHEVGRVIEFDRWTTLRHIILPGAVRSIATGLQIALTSAWIGTIGAEYLIDEGSGLGVALSSARIDNRMDLVLVYMITLALIGFGLTLVVRAGLARHALRSGTVTVDD